MAGQPPPEQGQVTVWMLGVMVILLFVGGLGIDLWRAVSERQRLVGLADSAAVAGASAVDAGAYRIPGAAPDVAPDLVRERVLDHLAGQDDAAMVVQAAASVDDGEVVVDIRGRIELTLLRVLSDAEAIEVDVQARAWPQRVDATTP